MGHYAIWGGSKSLEDTREPALVAEDVSKGPPEGPHSPFLPRSPASHITRCSQTHQHSCSPDSSTEQIRI